MTYLTLIGTVIFIHFLAVVSPGPDFIMTVKNSLSYGRRVGIFTAIGIGLGIGVHILYCALGLALIISKSIIIFNIIKFLGAAYLIYIGVMSFRSSGTEIKIEKKEYKETITNFKAFRIGFLTNVLNPKATLFFLSLFTFVIDPSIPVNILVMISIILIINTAVWFSLVSIFFTQNKVQSIFNKIQGTFNKVFGGILIAIGIKIVLTSK